MMHVSRESNRRNLIRFIREVKLVWCLTTASFSVELMWGNNTSPPLYNHSFHLVIISIWKLGTERLYSR